MDLGHKETDKRLEELTKDLQALYTSAFKDIEKKYLETNYLINHFKNVADTAELEKLYRRSERLEAQLKAIARDISNANNEAYKMINGELLNVYDLNYKYGAYSVETDSGYEVYTDYNIFNRDIIKRLVADKENPFTLIKLDEMLDQDFVYRELKRVFLTEIIKGGTINDIAKRVTDIVNKNLNDTIRIARTETTRLESMGRQDSFMYGKEQGLQLKKVWISTADKRTRDRHLRMNGELRELEERFSNGLMYPGEFGGKASEVINCRCTHVTELQGVEKSAKLQALDDKYKKATFDEWQRRKQAEADKQAKKQAKNNKNSGGDLTPLIDKIGTRHKESILKELSKCKGRETEVFYKYLDKINFNDRAYNKGAHYDPNKGRKYINMNVDRDATGKKGNHTTLFHEYGHLIDDFSDDSGIFNYTSTQEKYEFGQKLKDDFNNYLAGVKQELKSQGKKTNVSDLIQYINRDKRPFAGHEFAGISDIVEGASNGRYYGDYGHGKSYWKSPGALELEAFANMFQCYINGTEEAIKLFEDTFPTATEAYKEIINDILGG